MNLKNTHIAIIGDLHKDWNDILFHLNYLKLRDTIFIQVGDFGMGLFNNPETEENLIKQLDKALTKAKSQLLVIRGNHDDPKYFRGDNIYDLNSVFFIPDYTVVNINNQNWLMIGGAVSVDRMKLKMNFDYWPDCPFQLKNVEDLKNIDYVVTHNAPSFCHPRVFGNIVYHYANKDTNLLNDLRDERTLIESIYNMLSKNNKIKKWFYGHFHNSRREEINGTEFILLDINEHYELR
jgi:DNA repair exonuclease SbcCD nuclease subunit